MKANTGNPDFDAVDYDDFVQLTPHEVLTALAEAATAKLGKRGKFKTNSNIQIVGGQLGVVTVGIAWLGREAPNG